MLTVPASNHFLDRLALSRSNTKARKRRTGERRTGFRQCRIWGGTCSFVSTARSRVGLTDPSKGFFSVFRFYGPLEGYIEKTWVLNDFELME